MKKIILVNLPFEKIYEKTSLKGIAPSTPPLGLACIAGSLTEKKHQVKIFDFNLYDEKKFSKLLEEFNPDYVGISFVTPLINEANRVAKIVKNFNEKIILVGGGPHCSSFPEKVLEETILDIVVIGEGDFVIQELVEGKKLNFIKGVGYRVKNEIKINKRADFIKDLDELPFPAHFLYEIQKYKVPSAIAKNNPVAWLETSRGCVYGCIYCNKSCFGRTFRVKSPERVAQEFSKIEKMGFKEVHLTDDGFTTDMTRAKKICDLLIEKKNKLAWSTITGIRVDRVDFELLDKMKRAGCYRVYFGIESGNQQILNNIKKGITLEQVRNSVKLAKKAKLEVAGFFMIGLPGETKETMQQTIDFAKELNLDLAKISITIPLPATEMFNELDKKNLIKTHDWEKFKFYSTPSSIYNHENLSWPLIEKYFRKFYRKVYLNPNFILKRLKKSFKEKTFFEDIRMALTIDFV
ncbi:radical SAM protein [Candidatus Pacearchaeota archaeon]|nr:radical SAM protein [Candidatus Pacearchaeota archaeon]